MHKVSYPFTAIVGQEKVKKALLLNLICPKIGGALLSGEKGTAKSTLIRSVEQLMGEVKVNTIPLSATEDRVVGTVNMEEALLRGKMVFEPGILMQAHKNILYIDEVNLLSDTIVSTVLDSAAMGVNIIEREGLTYSHPCEFILFGSMNPEEGQMKPQILDRFGFFVEVKGSEIKAERIEIMKRRMAFEENPIEFYRNFERKEQALLEKINRARKVFGEVKIEEEWLELIANLNLEAFAAGHRGDIALTLGAMANAALDGRRSVHLKDIKEIAELVLCHRFRTLPPLLDDLDDSDEQDETDDAKPEENEDQQEDQESARPEEEKEEMSPEKNEPSEAEEHQLESDDQSESTNHIPEDKMEADSSTSHEEEKFEIGEVFKAKDILGTVINQKVIADGNGRRNKTVSSTKMGRYIKYRLPKGKVVDIAFDATLRNAAVHQKSRDKGDLLIAIKREDIREKVREKRVGNTILFLVDASGSMGMERRMAEAKGAIFSLLQDAYQNRDTVGMMTFRGNDVEMVLNPTRSVDLAYKKLQEIKVGGKTPLALGVKRSVDLIRGMKAKSRDIQPMIVIISDGRGNVPLTGKNLIEELESAAMDASKEKIQFVVVDTEIGFLKLGLAEKLAENLNALYFKLEELRDGELAETIKTIAN